MPGTRSGGSGRVGVNAWKVVDKISIEYPLKAGQPLILKSSSSHLHRWIDRSCGRPIKAAREMSFWNKSWNPRQSRQHPTPGFC